MNTLKKLNGPDPIQFKKKFIDSWPTSIPTNLTMPLPGIKPGLTFAWTIAFLRFKQA